MELQDVIQFFNQLMKLNPELQIDTFVNGNMDKDDCIQIVEQINNLVNHRLLPSDEEPVSYILKLPTNRVTIVERRNTNPEDSNSSVNVHFQLGERTLESKVKTDLLVKIIRSYFFDSLRTKQQLGYSVHTREVINLCSIAFQFLVQGSTHHPRDIYVRIGKFIEHFAQVLQNEIDDNSFEGYKDALIKLKLKPHKKLAEESQLYWTEIFYQRLHWTKVEDEVRVLSQMTKQDLVAFYLEHFLAEERRELGILVYGNAFNIDEVDKANEFVVLNADAYDCVGQDMQRFKQTKLTSRYPIKFYENLSCNTIE
jgi:secreted Zn-dependent insulinase-like peptidase